MKPRVIKTNADYEEALRRIDTLMDSDPGPDTEDGRELELLAMLVEQYEDIHYPMDLPNPIEAIKFRMDQQDLKQADLVPYIGSKSKVSEVLNGKRPLSLKMIRALHKGLGIPANVLLQEANSKLAEPKHKVSEYPFAQLVNRGYFGGFEGTLQQAKEYGEELLNDLLSVFGNAQPVPVFCRRSDKAISDKAILAWQARVLHEARKTDLPPFERDATGDAFAGSLAKLSYLSEGPKAGIEFLNKKGIHVIVLKHLDKTYLDGASFLGPKGNPVIGITTRHDRIDNFWFTLLHELGHVFLHLKDGPEAFFDDTDKLKGARDKREIEANDFARKALIPDAAWNRQKTILLRRVTEQKIRAFADSLNIHPGIVAGRIQWERKNYKIAPTLTGRGKIRKLLSPLP